MKKFLPISIFLVVLDQLSKFLMRGKSLVFVKDFFGLVYTKNFGASFGLLQGQRVFLIVVSFLVLGLIAYYYKNLKWKLPLAFLAAGTIGNLIDRMFSGYVSDFIFVWKWPTFNLADTFIFIGVALLLYSAFAKKNKKF